MRRLATIGILSSLLMAGGCASIPSVERAQAAADAAMSQAQAAAAAAQKAQATADQANSRVEQLGQKVEQTATGLHAVDVQLDHFIQEERSENKNELRHTAPGGDLHHRRYHGRHHGHRHMK
jgi:hypothetical protein